METESKQEPVKSKDDHTLSVAIMHAIEIESNFKLYTYRIISPELYVERIKELIEYFKYEMK